MSETRIIDPPILVSELGPFVYFFDIVVLTITVRYIFKKLYWIVYHAKTTCHIQ